MPGSATRVIASFAALSLTSGAAVVSAQGVAARGPSAVRIEASMKAGRVVGMVRDEAGAGVPGVAVTAIGTTQAQAKTDLTGYFQLALVPGDYILRASRDGYVSPYRESVRIRAASELERHITITRQKGLPDRTVLMAGMMPRVGDPEDLPVTPVVRPTAPSSALQAWYLRHLPRTVLRDGAAAAPTRTERADLRYVPAFLDRALAGSARAATSFFSETDFTGQFNMLTSSALGPLSGWDTAMPRGIAYLSVGAAVGTHGDWRLRGAMSTAGLASWVALAEYEARDVQAHAFRVGMSYGAQRVADASKISVVAPAAAGRGVASVYGFDRWRVMPGLDVDYGLRVDRYDYVEGRHFVSPRLGMRLGVAPRTFVVASASSAVMAPGIDEFLPPPAAGPWLPPERTFAPLFADAAFVPERIQRVDVGLERTFGAIGRARSIGVRWFREDTRDQLATAFGSDTSRGLGHYYVATAGDVAIEGWALRASGWVTPYVRASVDYSLSRARWALGPQGDVLQVLMPEPLRTDRRYLHDVTSTIDARIPDTDTNLLVAYRLNTAMTAPNTDALAHALAGRFDVQLRQALPFQPISGSRVEVLLAINNLFRDPASGLAAGSYFDELLTIRTPRRVMGGVQVRF